MKFLSLILILLLPYLGLSYKKVEYMYHDLKADDSVHEDSVKITGKVLDDGRPLNEGLISTTDHIFQVKSNHKGNYSLIIPKGWHRLYFFKEQYSEIVTHEKELPGGCTIQLDWFLNPEIENISVKKPVIYVYSNDNIDAQIELNPKGEITYTYPEYSKPWNINIRGNKLLLEGEEYPYLFWEADQNINSFVSKMKQSEPDVVEGKNITKYLSKKLNQLGFNSKEKADFITYWGPQLHRQKYKLTWLIDYEVDSLIGDLNISPTPTNLHRVYLLAQECNENEEEVIYDVDYNTINRDGFCVIEWGGSLIPKFPKNVNYDANLKEL